MEVDPLSLVGTGLAIGGLLIEHFHFRAALQERIATLEAQARDICGIDKELARLDKDVRELATKVDLFWGALEAQLPGILLKGNPIDAESRTAKLLQQYKDGILPCSDMEELSKLLESEVSSSEHTAGEKLAIVLMLATIKSKIAGTICL